VIYGFPQQVASLRGIASEFLNECFAPSRLEARSLLRGVYLTSGTQEGTPLDRLLGTMAREFGLPRPAAAAAGRSGRSYFLTRLMREVIFAEASLVSLDPKVERRAKWTMLAAAAGCVLLLLILGGTWLGSYFGNRELIAQVHAAIRTYNSQYDTLQRQPLTADLRPIVPLLDTLRSIRSGYDERDLAPPIALTFGLYQGTKLGTAALESYTRVLDALLLPRLLSRLETQMIGQISHPDVLYQLLKVYLILGRQGPLDRDLVLQWLSADLLAAYPGEDDATLRDTLLAHAGAMLQEPLPSIPLNMPLIAQARRILTKEPLAEYSYNRLMRSKRVQSIPPWTISEYGGPGVSRVFQLRSGSSLDVGMPGIYTWAGYHNVFIPMLPLVTQDISEDNWVLGRPARDVAGTLRDASKLRRDVMGLYLDDYTRGWDAMLSDISMKPFKTVAEALDELSLLSAPASPLRDLLQSIDAQTMLSRPAATDEALRRAEARAARVGQRTAGFATFEARSGLSLKQNELATIVAEAFGSDPGGAPIDPAKRVDDHFRSLHEFVAGTEAKPSPLEAVLQKMQAMYQSFSQVANSPSQSASLMALASSSGGTGSPAAQLQDLTRDMPAPVAAMMQSVASSGTAVTGHGASQELQNAWRSRVLPLCQAAFNRYPFVPGSNADVPADDFARLLGPGGLMEQFFEQYLKPFVDTTQRPWRWQAAEGAPLGLSSDSLGEFDRANQIREALFGSGNQVRVRFELLPVALDPQVAQISFEAGGQILTYRHDVPEPLSFQWPGVGGKTLVRVTMTPTEAGQALVNEQNGPWALFRLLDSARVTPSSQPEKMRVVFMGASGTATFDLSAGSAFRNPFTLTALRSFRCPAQL
jgi:type VI secretion system protein ImpL